MKNKISNLTLILSFIALAACDDFLDAKPDKALVVPETFADLQHLMDNSVQVMDRGQGLSIISADEIEISDQGWASITNQIERNAYLWEKDVFEGVNPLDWNIHFQQIFYTNVVLATLDGMDGIEKSTETWKNLKGTAHFKRAYAYYNLSQLFTPPFNPNEDSPFGLPLRTSAAVNNFPPRSSVWQTFEFMENDLLLAIENLPDLEAIRTRPRKNAAKSLLARIYLIKHDFVKGAKLSDEVISSEGELLDFNSINLNLVNPFPINGNPEMIYYSRILAYSSLSNTNGINRPNPSIVNLYQENDLRKIAFFTLRPSGNLSFTGNYTGQNTYFGGVSLNEVYLIAAESNAWLGNLDKAKSYLETLLVKRLKSGTFDLISEQTQEDLINLILLERTKELFMRGLRWSDLRRLNLKPQFDTTIFKSIEGNQYSLPPNDARYTLLFPQIEIENNGYPQNPR